MAKKQRSFIIARTEGQFVTFVVWTTFRFLSLFRNERDRSTSYSKTATFGRSFGLNYSFNKYLLLKYYMSGPAEDKVECQTVIVHFPGEIIMKSTETRNS